MKIDIRKAESQDFPAIMQMIHEFAEFLGKSEKLETSVEDLIQNKEYFICLIAETEDKKPAGYALVSYNYHTWTGKSIYLDDLFVKEQFRGKHVGSKLIHAIFDLARTSDCKTVSWEVLNYNKNAIEFYKSLGAIIGDDNLNCVFKL
ncbi:MAG: GNAT family N-acetyltransferase [Dysgonomonas sp.]